LKNGKIIQQINFKIIDSVDKTDFVVYF